MADSWIVDPDELGNNVQIQRYNKWWCFKLEICKCSNDEAEYKCNAEDLIQIIEGHQ